MTISPAVYTTVYSLFHRGCPVLLGRRERLETWDPWYELPGGLGDRWNGSDHWSLSSKGSHTAYRLSVATVTFLVESWGFIAHYLVL